MIPELGSKFSTGPTDYTRVINNRRRYLGFSQITLFQHLWFLVIPVIVFGYLFQLLLLLKQTSSERTAVVEFNNSLNTIIVRVKMVIKLTPYAVFTFMLMLLVAVIFETLKCLLIYCYYVCCYVIPLVFVQMLTLKLHGISPIKFTKILTCYSACIYITSSYGTLPVTIKSLHERAGVSERVANFVGPIGANIGMNACGGIFPAVVAVLTHGI